MSRAAVAAVAARADFARIGQWIEPGARVLDLGCENGAMLEYLRDTRQARGVGVDIAPANIRECLARGLQVVQSDIENGLADFADDSFDAVVLSQTLQSIQRPERVLREMLRAGRVAIVSFPNFGYWRHRLQMLGGRTPRSRGLPFEWHSTPNVRYCTISDFEAFCAGQDFRVRARAFQAAGRDIFLRPNLRADVALYMLDDGA